MFSTGAADLLGEALTRRPSRNPVCSPHPPTTRRKGVLPGGCPASRPLSAGRGPPGQRPRSCLGRVGWAPEPQGHLSRWQAPCSLSPARCNGRTQATTRQARRGAVSPGPAVSPARTALPSDSVRGVSHALPGRPQSHAICTDEAAPSRSSSHTDLPPQLSRAVLTWLACASHAGCGLARCRGTRGLDPPRR